MSLRRLRLRGEILYWRRAWAALACEWVAVVFDRPGGAHPSSGNMVATTVDSIAARTWVDDGATSQDHAAALLKNRLYRRWGIKTAREYARIKIDGLRLVGGSGG